MRKTLTQGFSTFLRRHRAQAHFERRPLLDALAAMPPPAGPAHDDHALAHDLLAIARQTPAVALLALRSQADGLDAEEAARRLQQMGPTRCSTRSRCRVGCTCGAAT